MAVDVEALGPRLMGFGDSLMSTGLARGFRDRGKRAAFGDGTKIMWSRQDAHVFALNPNVAHPGEERARDLEWIANYKGRRLYNRQDGNRWVWNMDFRATPGEVVFAPLEIMKAKRHPKGFVLIEPNVPAWKSVAPNKDWGRQRYQDVAMRLRHEGVRVAQLSYGQPLSGVEILAVGTFRDALAALRRAAVYVGPEGGLHHGAAAVGVPAVVLFGGFIPPSVTGYDDHTNLTGGATDFCGSLNRCEHCRAALDQISPADVVAAALAQISRRAA